MLVVPARGTGDEIRRPWLERDLVACPAALRTGAARARRHVRTEFHAAGGEQRDAGDDAVLRRVPVPSDGSARTIFVDERHRERLGIQLRPVAQRRTQRQKEGGKRRCRGTIVGLAKERDATFRDDAVHLEVREREAGDRGDELLRVRAADELLTVLKAVGQIRREERCRGRHVLRFSAVHYMILHRTKRWLQSQAPGLQRTSREPVAQALLPGDARQAADVADINAVIGGFLRDLAFVQASPQKTFGYKRAARAVLSLDRSIDDLVNPDGSLPRVAGIGPASSRVIREVLESGVSATVERAVAESGRARDIQRRRELRQHFLSRAAVRRILDDPPADGLRMDYRGDLQMHSEWSDGQATLDAIVDACIVRGYRYAAVTDHSHGLRIAGGMSMAEAMAQHRAIDDLNARRPAFRLLKGIEANIAADGSLDLADEDARRFEIVLAAPHSKLRSVEDQTDRVLRAVRHPSVHILAHPRGRIANTRAGVRADWGAVFTEAAARRVAIEIDGDPARQDLDYTMARQARSAGCLFAIDSDAHTTGQLDYTDIALAHARLAQIPVERVINCWPLDRLLDWLTQARV